MKKSIVALTLSSAVIFAATVATASVPVKFSTTPETTTQLALAIDTPIRAPAISNQMQTASLARNCQDPDYSWYEYSGWEALACLYSGQW